MKGACITAVIDGERRVRGLNNFRAPKMFRVVVFIFNSLFMNFNFSKTPPQKMFAELDVHKFTCPDQLTIHVLSNFMCSVLFGIIRANDVCNPNFQKTRIKAVVYITCSSVFQMFRLVSAQLPIKRFRQIKYETSKTSLKSFLFEHFELCVYMWYVLIRSVQCCAPSKLYLYENFIFLCNEFA